MRKIALLFCFATLIFPKLALAQRAPDFKQKPAVETLPLIVVSGLEAYKAKGPEEAVRAWIKGSAMDGSKDALSQANILRQVQDFYGAYQSYDVVSLRDTSPHINVIYLVLNYEKGPLFSKFVLYRADTGWILISFNFNAKEEAIFPTNL
jgi:hypothetical protein